jgi:hypothetical protein
MIIHNDSMLREAPTHVLAEEINTLADLPAGWEPDCLPYTNYTYSEMPEHIVNKTIEEHLKCN